MPKKLPYLVMSGLLWVFPLIASTDSEQIIPLVVEEQKAVEKTVEETRPFESFTGKISGTKVRLRTQPSLEGHVVREISSGEMFAIEGIENDFYAVKPSKATKGYVFRTYILEGNVEGERVNVRLYPEMEAPVIGKLRAGDKVNAVISATNSKWFEIDLPETSRFYVAKEYVENIGPVALLAKMEERHSEATHLLNSAFLFGRSEIQKPFEEIDFDCIHQRFQKLDKEFSDFSDIVEKARDADRLLEETYIQKKIAFLESKADRTTASNEVAAANLKKLVEMGQALPGISSQEKAEGMLSLEESKLDSGVSKIGEAAAGTIGLSATIGENFVTDKMLVWKPLEESIYHLWAATHEGESMDTFYKEESVNATILTGIVEPYNRPVKNRPGDFLLRCEDLPVAFLYSTKINLQELVGKKITVIGTPRPNNNFAFPAYFVLSIE